MPSVALNKDAAPPCYKNVLLNKATAILIAGSRLMGNRSKMTRVTLSATLVMMNTRFTVAALFGCRVIS